MKIAFVGTESSLKYPIARSLKQTLQIPLYQGSLANIVVSGGIKSFFSANPDNVFKLLDEAVVDHSEAVAASAEGLFCLTSIEILAYYMYWCSFGCDEEQTRNVLKNCIHFTKNYDRIVLIVLDKDTYEKTELPYTGELMFDYTIEYIMRGIMNRFGVKHHVIHEKSLEFGKNAVLELL